MKGIISLLSHSLVATACALCMTAQAQKNIPSTENPVTIDFSGYTAAGFTPNPSSGQLDSDTWSVTGLSDGDIPFGGSGTSGDHARGTSTGGESTGGVYSFDNGISGEMLGIQATGSDFTPGDFRLKLKNNTGDTIYGLDLSYSVWFYNDAGRSNSIDLAYSMDNSSYTTLSSLTVQSPAAAAASPSWNEVVRDSVLSGIKVDPNDSLYLRWTGADVSGSGSRDEFGIDDISVQAMGTVDAGYAIAPDDTVCQGSLMTFQDSSNVQNDSIVSHEWDFGNGDTALGDTVTYSYSDSGLFDVKLVVTTQSGAMDSITQSVLIDTVGDPSFHYDTTSYCSAGTDPTPTITGDAGGTFSEGTGGLSIDPNTGTIDLSASSPGTYAVFYETSGDCPNSKLVEIEIVDQYDATIDSIAPLCNANDTVIDLVAPHEGGSWSGTGVVNDSTGGFNPNVATVDTHQVIHTIGGACGDADTIDIVVDSTSNATIDSVGTYCVPAVTDILTAQGSGGVWRGPGIIDSTAGEFSPNDAGVGTHSIVYEIKGGCPASDTIDIEVDSSKDATIDPAGPYCEFADTVQLSAADSGGVWAGNGIVDTNEGLFLADSAGIGSHTIIYQIDTTCGDLDSETIEVLDGVEPDIDSVGPYCVLDSADTLTVSDTGGTWSGPGIIDTSDGVFHPDSAGPGLHEIVYGFGGSTPCTIPDTMMIRVHGIPDASIDSLDSLCLNGDSAMLTAADTGGTWSGPGIVDAQNGIFDPSTAGLGTHRIYYSIDNLNACDATDSTEISVLETPTADFGWTNSGLDVQFSDSSSAVSGHAWEFGDGGTSSDQNPAHTYPQDSIYEACLMVFDSNGCTDTACYMVDLRDVSVRSYKEGEAGFTLRPNPASQRVELRFSKGVLEQNIRSIELLDLQGRQLRKEDFEEKSSFSWRVSELAPGTYFIRVLTDEGVAQRKFLVE